MEKIEEHIIFRRIRRDKKLTELGIYEPPSERLFHDIEGTARLLAQEPEGKHLLDILNTWYTAYRDVLLKELRRKRIDREKSILPPPMAATTFIQTWRALRDILRKRGFSEDEVKTAAAIFGVAALHPDDASEIIRVGQYRGIWSEAKKANRDDTRKMNHYSPQLTYLWPLNMGEKRTTWRNRFGLRKMKNLPITAYELEVLEKLRKNSRQRKRYYEELKRIIQNLIEEIERREFLEFKLLR